MAKSFDTSLKNVAAEYLKLLHVKITATTIKKDVEEHPYYPSLLSLSDSFQRYDIENEAFQLDAPNFFAKAAAKQGVDIKGSTKMGLIDESLDAKWELIDSQHVTGSDQVSVSIAGKTINNVLAKGEKDPVIFPITVGCKWSAPCPNYTSSAEYLAGVAAGRLTKAVGDEAKSKVQNAVQDAVKKAIGGGGNPLKNLFGH